MNDPTRRLLQLGVVLLLLALVVGLAIPALAVPRLGVASHVNAVIGALFLIVFGLIWPHLRLGPGASRLAFWLGPYSFLVASLMPLLGGIWGAGATMLPLAAGVARGSPFQEGVIAVGLITAAVAIIALCGLLLYGLRRGGGGVEASVRPPHGERRVEELIRTLALLPHPEGGYYREIWRGDLGVEPSDGRGPRSALTSIYFLLPAGAISRWHRGRSDEIWHHYEGAPLELLLVPPDELRLERYHLGPLAPEQVPVRCVPANYWLAARSLGAYTLVGCTVGPGFEFTDFELLTDRGSLADALFGALPDAVPFR